MIYISKPSMISAAGKNSNENIVNLQSGKRFLSVSSSYREDKKFILGMTTASLANFNKNTPEHFKTRTNSLILTALDDINDIILRAIKKYGKNRIGVVIGATTSGVEENYETFKEYAKTGFFDAKKFNISRNTLVNPSEFIAYHYGLNSAIFSISTACTSGVKAIMQAKRLIEANICDVVICGGVDSLNTLTINGFDSLGILSENETNPFSKNRDGINIGEGAALFLVSRDEISNVVVASEYSNCDAFHTTQPDFSAKMQTICVKSALDRAKISSVDYINLHGTGTIANDQVEAKVVHDIMPNVPSSSIKPSIGHTLGAAGAIESAVCVMLCQNDESILPPHIYDGVYDDSICPINLVKFGQKAVVKSAMSLSFAFGGDNAAIVFRRLN
ncbi:beta-ketoacyl synthase N-terminal-like domain-containing protein [Campylobacter sp. RM16192]|uniref:beta-ketoacyl synthase N-terminal-like domain-containing protein n=1 Tax=Campylobacter sp. RM16192 TaxID=1660080 RepID=UPI0014529FEE|nr:beta-ketoacyl synthase N-terminal-like domain-containing protein [Campylobacter sp. RM16192]QCD52733.1 3-oxoacyl-[acp] synthase I [Campylobacter sp. RM16192]